MKILALSDWRSNPLEDIEQIILKSHTDMVAYCGDDINRFREMHSQFTGAPGNEGEIPPEKVVDVAKLMRGVSWATLQEVVRQRRELNRFGRFLKILVRAQEDERKNLFDMVIHYVKRTKAPDVFPATPLLIFIARIVPRPRWR